MATEPNGWRAAERAAHEAKADAIADAIHALLDLPDELRAEFPIWNALQRLERARETTARLAERV